MNKYICHAYKVFFLMQLFSLSFVFGCAKVDYKWYLIDRDTPASQERWQQGRERKGVRVYLGFERKYRDIGIPLIFKVSKTVGPNRPSLEIYSYDDIDFILIKYVKLIFDSDNSKYLDNNKMPIRKKMKYSETYKHFEVCYRFSPIEIDFETVEGFNAEIEIEGHKNDELIFSKVYNYTFKRSHVEGIDFFYFLSFPT